MIPREEEKEEEDARILRGSETNFSYIHGRTEFSLWIKEYKKLAPLLMRIKELEQPF